MAESVYAGDLKSLGEILTGSSPVPGTSNVIEKNHELGSGQRPLQTDSAEASNSLLRIERV